MKDSKNIDLITGYLDGTLNQGEMQQVQKRMAAGDPDFADLPELKQLNAGLNSAAVPEPGPRMQQRFYAMLEAEKGRAATKPAYRWSHLASNGLYLRNLGFALALFMVGLLVGDLFNPLSSREDKIDMLTTEVSQMREVMMISLLENESPVERLRAVNISHKVTNNNTRVVEALLSTLNNDTNVNVRIAAVDALVERGAMPEARMGLINAITQQDSPMVQVALADAMISLQEPKSVGQFQKLLAQDDLNHTVRNKIENTILALN